MEQTNSGAELQMSYQDISDEVNAQLHRSRALLRELQIFDDYLARQKKPGYFGNRTFQKTIAKEIRRLEKVC